MRRVARIAGFLALIWLALSSLAAPGAKAQGWVGLHGIFSDLPSACKSWGDFYGIYQSSQILPESNPGGLPDEGECFYTNGQWITNPLCSYWGLFQDAYMPDGCVPYGAGAVLRALGCGRGNSDGGNPSPTVGNPICVTAGNKFEVVTDFATPTPDKLAFTRYYNSGNPLGQTTMLGNGWRSAFDAYIDTTKGASGPVYYSRADGQTFEIDYSSGTGWHPHDTDADLTVTQSGSSWTLTDSDDTVSTFTQLTPQAAMLASMKTRSGYMQTLQYNASNQLASVTDSYGRTLQFTYANGLMQSMTVPDGSVYQYLYAASSGGQGMLLTRVVKPGHSPTSPPQNYLYENTTFPLALTGIVDDNGNRFATFTLEQYGRPITSQHAGGADSTSVTYNDNNYSRIVTNPLGKQETYWLSWNGSINNSELTEIDRAASSSTPAASEYFSYDSNGYLSSKKDWNGILTTRTNNARGMPLSITSASGTPQARTVTYAWDPTYHVPTQIVEPGRTTTFTYSNGLLVTKTETDTTTATVPYSTNGRTRSWTYTYTPTGLVQTVKGPRTDVNDTRTYGYDASGTLVSVTNALNQTTQITQHDGSGRPLTTVDANGVTTNLAYTPEGWLSTVTVVAASGNAVTTIAYDAQGEITKITRPDGSSLSYTYDQAHRLVRVADAFDERIDYTLDAMGNRTLEQIHSSGGTTLTKTQSRVFDDLGRLLQSIGAANQTTTYAYDNDGDLTGITDPLSHVTGQSFDALNRLIQVAAPLSSTSAYGYDAHDNRTQVTDPRGLVTSNVYDGLDNLIQVTSPDTGTTVYVVDDAGNRIQETDAAGNVVQMSYDALNRVTARTWPGDPAENVAYSYDQAAAGFGIGRLTGVADASGSTIYFYDARGNVLQEGHVIAGENYVTSYAYDLADHVVQITYPSGRIVTYTRDGMGRITGVTTQTNALATAVTVASGATYAPFGPLTALTYGNGLALAAQYDEDYQPSSRLVAGTATVQDLTYGFDAAGNVMGITDLLAGNRSQTFQYDALDRLTYASGLYGALTYGYDAVGNRTSQSGGSTNLAETYSYAANSNQLQSVVNSGVTRSISYTPSGNTATDNHGNGTVLNFTYNEARRVVQVANQNQPLATYTYNFLGQRAQKTTSSTITQFLYDRSGHLLAESNGSTGAAQTEYIWLDDTPLALVTSGNLYFIHPDHLGTPQKATDANQNLAWDAVLRPFGQVEQQTFPPLTNLRFPGQYFDVESALHQNWFRDYDPSIGRYVESDPIGLKGGNDTYSYADGNPVNTVDQTGELAMGPLTSSNCRIIPVQMTCAQAFYFCRLATSPPHAACFQAYEKCMMGLDTIFPPGNRAKKK